jgi:glycosyltransferase involved in cell wall biosynthesis
LCEAFLTELCVFIKGFQISHQRPHSAGSPRLTLPPRITVVMPCFNAERYIGAALQSVLAQDWKNLEIIVVDDGSSDGSAALVTRDYPTVHLLRQANRGVAAARNLGIANATGDLIAFIDADDYWLPGKLWAQCELLEKNPAARMVYTSWVEWPSDRPAPDTKYLQSITGSVSTQNYTGPSGWIYTALLLDSEVWTCTVLAQRSLFDEIGTFDPDLTIGEDYDLWLRASRVTEIVRVQQPLALYRKHNNSITTKAPAQNFQALVVTRALRKWGYASPDGVSAIPSQVNKALARAWRNYADAHLKNANWRIARQSAVSALRLDPCNVGGWRILAKSLLNVGVHSM